MRELSEKEKKLCGELGERVYELLLNDTQINRTRMKLAEGGLNLVGISFDALFSVRLEEKRIFYGTESGQMTFTEKDDEEFRKNFNITLRSPDEK